MNTPKDRNQKEEAERLINELSKLCGSNGWDFYGAIFMESGNWFDRWTEGGNNFIRQCTMISCTSPGLQTMLGLPWIEAEEVPTDDERSE